MISTKFNKFKKQFNANDDNIKELVNNRKTDNINYIDTTNVTNMNYLFKNSTFNVDISLSNICIYFII